MSQPAPTPAVTARRGLVLAAISVMVWSGGSASALAQAGAAVKPVPLAPHRAVYDITLANTKAASGVGEVVGRMVYEMTGNACDGYTQNMRFVTRIAGTEGNEVVSDMRSSTWESGLGDEFRFQTSQLRDQKSDEATVGDAKRKDAAIVVDLTRPEKKEIKLPQDAVFPMQHTLGLLAAAREGRQLYIAKLYDGSEKGAKVYATTAVIGRMRPPGANAKLPVAKNAEVLNGLRAWPVSISYFEEGKAKADGVPDYELAFLAFENGVSRKLFIDYGDFSIRGTLSELELLKGGGETAPCPAKTR